MFTKWKELPKFTKSKELPVSNSQEVSTDPELVGLLREIRDLLQDDTRRTKIDVEDVVKELGSGKLIHPLRHYSIWNDRWVKLIGERNQRAAATTYDFIQSELSHVPFIENQFDVIESRADEIRQAGDLMLDLGVYKGGSTRALARTFPETEIHGFDSFEGLPEDWSHALKGVFGDVSGALPDVPDTVRLYKGWFSDTLPEWRTNHEDETIGLLRVDCDIYSSTKDIFDAVGDMLSPSCFICFDELFGYWGWEHHEYKAFMEFIEATGYRFEYLSYGLTYCLVRLVP